VRVRESFAHICLLGTVVLQAITSGAQPVTKIAAGISRSLLLKSDGTLWTVGYVGPLEMEADGGTNNKTNQPPQPPQLVASNVTAMAAGGYHTLFLKSDGSLWAKGANQFGQLGDGHYNNNPNRPELIVASNVTAIAAGSAHSLFLKSDGSLWGMGLNFFGQLGYGTDEAVLRPVQIVASNVTAIAAGGSHSLFLKTDGSLWAMGWNKYGQLGDGTTNNTNRSKQIVTDPTKNNFWRIH
jgi:alpha-tubulin suppressor-like RCC1 family protein